MRLLDSINANSKKREYIDAIYDCLFKIYGKENGRKFFK